MMNNMFSMFDPSSSFLSANWLIMIFMTLMMFKNSKFNFNNKMKNTTFLTYSFIQSEINQLIKKKAKMSTTLLMKMFLLILCMNMLAIFPFNFTPTAHISVSFTLSLSMWMSIMLFGWINQFKNMMIHLTPLGTPNSLMNFMVIIETVSGVIRPITLSIRLSANMVAGHLLMSLLSSFSLMSGEKMMISTTVMLMLTLLEMGVALVQAYVLITLLLLYQNET